MDARGPGRFSIGISCCSSTHDRERRAADDPAQLSRIALALQWVIDAYAALAAMLLTTGSLADHSARAPLAIASRSSRLVSPLRAERIGGLPLRRARSAGIGGARCSRCARADLRRSRA